MTSSDEAHARFERIVLRGRRRYTLEQLRRVTGVPSERTQRLWRALGFADVTADQVVFTDGDVNAIRQLEQLRASGVVPIEVQEAVIRSMAVAMSGLADWQVNRLYQRTGDPPTQAHPDEAVETARAFLPALARLQSYIWRRQLVVAAARARTMHADHESARPVVVGSADMVGFTLTTRRLDPAELVDLVEGFHGLAIEQAAENRGRIVKTIGDEVLFVADEPADAAELALGLLDRAIAAGMPELRVGMALGPVLHRFGDVHGEVVHMADQLGAHARPGRVLVDRELASALEGDRRFALRLRRPIMDAGNPLLLAWGLRRAADQRRR